MHHSNWVVSGANFRATVYASDLKAAIATAIRVYHLTDAPATFTARQESDEERRADAHQLYGTAGGRRND
jgi:hypothetical protein